MIPPWSDMPTNLSTSGLSERSADDSLDHYPSDSIQHERRVTAFFLALTLAVGLLQIWTCRYHMDPDSMDYLDIARELAAGHWSALANGYWSTFDSLLMAPLFWLRLSPEMELSLAHIE